MKPNDSNTPYPYRKMIEYLAQKDNVPSTTDTVYTSIEEAKKSKRKISDMIFVVNGKEMKCSGSRATGKDSVNYYISNPYEDFFEMPDTTPIERVIIRTRKLVGEFSIEPESAGDYKNCEGGGWYSMANLYKIDDLYFTDAF